MSLEGRSDEMQQSSSLHPWDSDKVPLTTRHRHHSRNQDGQPAAVNHHRLPEKEPLLSQGTNSATCPGNSDDVDEETTYNHVKHVTSDCPSVVSGDVRNPLGDVGQVDDVTRVGRQPRDVVSGDVRRRQNDVLHYAEPNAESRQREGCDDVTSGQPYDVLDKGDAREGVGSSPSHGARQGDGSCDGVTRSLTSDCVLLDKAPSTKGDKLKVTAGEHRKTSRRHSSGDAPYWQRSQDAGSDTNAFTLIVPSPSENYLIGRASPRGDAAQMRMTRLTEVAPTNSSIVDGEEDQWKMPLHLFTSKKQGRKPGQRLTKRIRSYYKAQDQLITAYEDIRLKVSEDLLDTEDIKKQRKMATLFSKITLAVNMMLLVAKLVASIMSGSMSIISSLVDSVVDLLSGAIMWWATQAVRRRDPYTYPQGRTKLEPVSIIILSVVMGLASLQLVRESVEKVVILAGDSTTLPRVEAVVAAIAASTVVIKFVLWLVCRKQKNSIVQTLAKDHRNDVLSNLVAIICGYLGSREFQEQVEFEGQQGFIFVDPVGAIIISLYIVYNWWQTGYEQIKMLTGHTARPDFLSKLTWTAMNHDRNIRHIDTVRAFHFGNNFLVEMDIVLPEDMSLRVAHDIGESLQQKLESIPEVERAFVHLDYEYSHNPNSEHKVV